MFEAYGMPWPELTIPVTGVVGMVVAIVTVGPTPFDVLVLVASHFNDSTLRDTAIFAVMGVTITIGSVVVACVLWRVFSRPPDLAPAYLWGIRFGSWVQR